MKAERLREILDYDPSTGIFTNKFSRGRARSGAKAGCLNALGYVRICVDGVDYYAHRLAWLYLHGKWPTDQLDHINGNRADNRISNLRPADNAQNNMNRALQANNSSGYKGVSLHKQSGLWFAYARASGRRHSAGYHKTPDDAYRAACSLRAELHKSFALDDYRKTEAP